MEDINKKLMEIKSKINERERMKRILNDELENEKNLKLKKEQLKLQLEKENLDVKKLENISITKFIHMIKGDTDEKLEKEKREALAAKLKYDGACQQLTTLSYKTKKLRRDIDSYYNLEEQYDNLIKEKEKLIKNLDSEYAKKLEYIMEQEINNKKQIKEISEAITAGESLMESLLSVQDLLRSAANWGTYDIWGGGMIATMAKHSKLDEATTEINRAQSLLNRFQVELSDIGDEINIEINIDSFLRFADYFFDGLIADCSVQSRIRDAQDKVFNTIDKVKSLIIKLRNNLSHTQEKLNELEDNRKSIIESV